MSRDVRADRSYRTVSIVVAILLSALALAVIAAVPILLAIVAKGIPQL